MFDIHEQTSEFPRYGYRIHCHVSNNEELQVTYVTSLQY